MEYCVAIRTLGSAGEKFQKELDSIISQTIKPQGIFVYIPEGYPIPKETVGIEQYIRCRKGMVAQRALPYNEITTPLCLFLDDDVYLPPDAVETMINAMIAHQGDCIVADTFKNQDMNVRSKIKSAITNWALPRRDDNWAFKIGYTATFSYNNHPRRNVYPSQSGAGPCSLWRIEALRQIHFEDELWMDKFGFAYGDDLLYFHKLFRNGGKLLTLYHSGIEHMDAQSSRKSYDNSRKFYIRAKNWYVLWRRTQIDAADVSALHNFLAHVFQFFRIIWEVLLHLIYSVLHLSPHPLFLYIKGLCHGWQFVRSKEYRSIPNFIVR